MPKLVPYLVRHRQEIARLRAIPLTADSFRPVLENRRRQLQQFIAVGAPAALIDYAREHLATGEARLQRLELADRRGTN